MHNNTKTTDIAEIKTTRDLFGRHRTTRATIKRDVLANVLKQQLRGMSLEQFVGLITNPYREILEYAALLEGKRTCLQTSLLFNPHRLDTRHKNSRCSIYGALQYDQFVSALARVTLWQRGTEEYIKIEKAFGAGFNEVRHITEFPPYVMRDLLLRYKMGPHSRVLDPCGGWGGRMLGASCVVNEYSCYEPSTKTHAGLKRLKNFIQGFRPAFRSSVHNTPFENWNGPEFPIYDMAVTSPPYYDTELYADGEPTQSHARYKSFDAWCAGFYVTMIRKTMAALKPGAPFIINISSRKYPLAETIRKHFGKTLKITNMGTFLNGQCGSGGGKKDGTIGETFHELRTI